MLFTGYELSQVAVEADAFLHQSQLPAAFDAERSSCTTGPRNYHFYTSEQVQDSSANLKLWFVSPVVRFGHRLLALRLAHAGVCFSTGGGPVVPAWVYAYCLPEFLARMLYVGKKLDSRDLVVLLSEHEKLFATGPNSAAASPNILLPPTPNRFQSAHKIWKLTNFDKLLRAENSTINTNTFDDTATHALYQDGINQQAGGAQNGQTTDSGYETLLPVWAAGYQPPVTAQAGRRRFGQSAVAQQFLPLATN
ncbi:unnamed protein product, partial [Amoebophrya sp. A120]|eukprot:GSA120T00012666001.1